AVTALRVPDGLDGDAVRKHLRERYGCELAGGQGPLKGKIMRFGHLGFVAEPQVLQGLALLGQALRDQGLDADGTSAVAAAREAMQR
ncbi:MAG: alanine--glyoxylate aminotransferase family protein, partial [Armatimonadetes bacterium]|nr:alanine--glyoxylate aminotransferase family protein [Armatimonadota bacterium]